MTDVLRSIRTTSCGHKILVADNAFAFHEMEHFYRFLETSLYTAITYPSKIFRSVPTQTMISVYTEQDNNNLGLLQRPQIADLIPEHKTISSWANLGQPGTFVTKHTDIQESLEEATTLIYCANLHWEDHFGGDLLFCNKHGEKEIAVAFKPGRMIIFNSKIPHLITTTCGIAPIRYAYVVGFLKD